MAEATETTGGGGQSSTTETGNSDDAAAAAAAANAGGKTGGQAASGADDTPWFAGLPADLQKDRNITKYESAEAFARGHLHALNRFGKDPSRLIEIPEKPDDKAGWDAVYNALGRPPNPEDYGVSIFEGASDGDQKFARNFVERAHAAGASKAVVAAAIETLNEAGAAALKAANEARAAETKATQDQLKKDWGDKHGYYTTAIGKLLLDGGDEIAGEGGGDKLVEEMNAKGLGNSPVLMKLLASLIDKQAEPEGLPGGGRGDGGAMTPYQAQAALAEMRGDPETAEALRDNSHPMHKVKLAERDRLLKIAFPGRAEGQKQAE